MVGAMKNLMFAWALMSLYGCHEFSVSSQVATEAVKFCGSRYGLNRVYDPGIDQETYGALCNDQSTIVFTLPKSINEVSYDYMVFSRALFGEESSTSSF
jgi:hypothetical protein